MTDRRQFLGSAAAFAGALAFPHGLLASGTPNLRFGFLSDVHLCRTPGDMFSSRTSFVRALSWYRERGVDAIVVSGDLTETGYAHELMDFAASWNEVFPGNRAPDGRHVERIFVYGNHDVADWLEGNYKSDGERRREMICYDMKGHWERAFGEPFEPAYVKTVNGSAFICAHWPIKEGMKGYHFSAVGTNWPKMTAGAELVGRIAPTLDPAKPFFYVQHAHPKNSCFGPWASCGDDGTSTAALARFPNAVALSGHSHYSLTDERSVWQGGFTSVGGGSLAFTWGAYNFRENAVANLWGEAGKARVRRMPHLQTEKDGRQGSLVSVFDDRIVIERHDFNWGESLGEDWVIPLGIGAARPYAYATRRTTRTAPEFPVGARVALQVADSEDDVRNPLPRERQLRVTFPAAEARGGCRTFEYEVRALAVTDDLDGMVVSTRRALAPDYHLPAVRAGRRGEVRFPLADFVPNTGYRFEVRPLECFGRAGRPILSGLWKHKEA